MRTRALGGATLTASLLALIACAAPAPQAVHTTEQAPPASEEEMTENVEGLPLRLTVNGAEVEATMVDNATSREFASLLPVTVSMRDMLGRDAYGDGLPEELTHDAPRRTDYAVGELVYWPPTNGIAVYYRHAGTPVPEPGLIPLGTITDDMEIFDLSGGPAEVTIEIGEGEG